MVNNAEVDGKKLVISLQGEDDFEDLLLELFDCATPTFRFDSDTGRLVAALE